MSESMGSICKSRSDSPCFPDAVCVTARIHVQQESPLHNSMQQVEHESQVPDPLFHSCQHAVSRCPAVK